jgi:hypothetical protein
MDMKRQMLICFFISMLVDRGKEWGSYFWNCLWNGQSMTIRRIPKNPLYTTSDYSSSIWAMQMMSLSISTSVGCKLCSRHFTSQSCWSSLRVAVRRENEFNRLDRCLVIRLFDFIGFCKQNAGAWRNCL